MSKYQINASILSANCASLGDEISNVLSAGADNIHFDVMDNHYVNNLSFGPVLLSSLEESGIDSKFDIHLMARPVDSLIKVFSRIGCVSSIVFHPETSSCVYDDLMLIKSYGIQAGLALNIHEEIESCIDYLPLLNRILVMTVKAGFGGQNIILDMFRKIKKVSKVLKSIENDILLEVDGGVKLDNIRHLSRAGAQAFVCGSSIFKSTNYKLCIQNMKEELSINHGESIK